MTWRTRRKGSKFQRGLHFPTTPQDKRYTSNPSPRPPKFQVHPIIYQKPRNVTLRKGYITLQFDGEILSNRVKILPHVKMVASWNPHGNEIYFDDDMPRKYFIPLGVHESIEKYLYEKYGIDPLIQGHELADEIEKRWFIPRYGEKEWEAYSREVERVYRKEEAHLMKKGGTTVIDGQRIKINVKRLS